MTRCELFGVSPCDSSGHAPAYGGALSFMTSKLLSKSRQNVANPCEPLGVYPATSSDDAIISKGLDGHITTRNAAAMRIFGYTANEMIGQSIYRIIPPELHEQEKEILARLQRRESIYHYETVAKDGRRIDISLTVSPLCDTSVGLCSTLTLSTKSIGVPDVTMN